MIKRLKPKSLRSLEPRRRWYATEDVYEKLLSVDPNNQELTYPSESEVLTPRHFYQVHVARWLQRKPRPVTLKQMIAFGRDLSEQKVLLSAQYAADELITRFAHRIRQMQTMPYRIMGNPHLSNVYEYHVLSFELMRKSGTITTMEDNLRFCEESSRLLTMHTRIVVDIIGGVLELVKNGISKDDYVLLNALVKSLLTSRLSRRVLVKQHQAITDSYLHHQRRHRPKYIGEVYLACTIHGAVRYAEERAREALSLRFPEAHSLPPVQIEGDADLEFPYILKHVDYIVGEVLRNSLEACLRTGSKEPVKLSVSHSNEYIFVRVSDRGGGFADEQKLKHIWSFAKPLDQYPPYIDNEQLATHGFYNLLFPVEDVSDATARHQTRKTLERDPGTHFGIGLALARLYIEYFGGTLDLHSLDGFGCDVMLQFSRLGTSHENLRLT